MKIGIITFHHTTNYGATLQAYALSRALELWGNTVEIIDYRPKGAVSFYARQLLPIRNKRLEWNGDFYKHIAKAFRMRKFLHSALNLSQLKCYSQSGLSEIFKTSNYDAVITGSDQVWCLDTRFRQFDPSYFLNFFRASDGCLKVSYAPSVGETKSFREKRDTIRSLLKEFDYVSVRDRHSASVIQKECGIASRKVLDPTFLVNYDDVLTPPRIENKYLLVYNHKKLGNVQKEAIQHIAKTKTLKVISIGDVWDIADHNFVSVSPKEWIGYFKYATYVFTNTFHGTIFSLLFRKDFTVYLEQGKRNKIFDLLSPLNLEDRIITDFTECSQINSSAVEYDPVYKRLNPQIDDSKDFLAQIFNPACLPV